MDKYKNDPTNEYETVKEYTNEELYDQYASENEIPEVVEIYINDLENQIKLLTKKLKENEFSRNSIGKNSKD
jgi:predicted ribosome quality control (RQC) complex YloA/Tae2 family protein